MNIRKIESKTQEVIFLFTWVLSLVLILALTSYLVIDQKSLISILGKNGFDFIKNSFDNFGLALFILPLCIFALGKFLLKRITTPKDFIAAFKFILINLLADSIFLVVLASLFAISQHFYHLHSIKILTDGLGGSIGEYIGGNLFFMWGVLGSVSFLLLMSFSIGIISGHIHLVNSLFLIVQGFQNLVKFILIKFKQLLIYTLKSIKKLTIDSLKTKYKHYIMKKSNPEELESILLRQIMDDSEFDTGPQALEKSNTVGSDIESIEDAPAEENVKRKKPKLKAVSDDTEEEKDTKKTASKKTSNKKVQKNKDEDSSEENDNIDKDEILVTPYKKRYPKPEVSLLKKASKPKVLSKTEIAKKAKLIEDRLASFQVTGKIVHVHTSVRLTMFEFSPDAGVKISKLTSYTDDLALTLGASSIRILTPIPGKTTVGIEVPNENPGELLLSEFISDCQKKSKTMELPIALGRDVFNKTIIEDLAKMPHMLVSGTTGSGKSVFTNSMISSLIYSKSPKELRFLMIDPKMIELSTYNGIPHLLKPVVTDVDEAKGVLVWAMKEMDKRYNQLSDVNARNIVNFNQIINTKTQKSLENRAKKKFNWQWDELPYIVIVIDELADLMITHGKEVETPITRLAQKARAAGIHLVIATQRPSAEIVTGLIKTNFPARLAFKVSSAIDSRTILDASGAEKLLGLGDALYKPNGKPIQRLQSSFVSEQEVGKVVDFISE